MATCSPGGCKESDRCKHTHSHTYTHTHPRRAWDSRTLLFGGAESSLAPQGPCFSVFLFCLCLILPPLSVYMNQEQPPTHLYSPQHILTLEETSCAPAPQEASL